MTKLQTNVRLTEDTRIKLDQIAISKRKDTGMDVTQAGIITDLIENAYANLKRVVPIRENKKTIGWACYYGDHFVGEFDGAASKPQAEKALDAFVWEELSK